MQSHDERWRHQNNSMIRRIVYLGFFLSFITKVVKSKDCADGLTFCDKNFTFVETTATCLLVSRAPTVWSVANTKCRSQDSVLVDDDDESLSKVVQNFARTKLESFDQYWIGMRVNSTNGSVYCIALDITNGSWIENSCQERHPYICQISIPQSEFPSTPTLHVEGLDIAQPEAEHGETITISCSAHLGRVGTLKYLIFSHSEREFIELSDDRVTYSEDVESASRGRFCTRFGTASLQLVADTSINMSFIGCVSFTRNDEDVCSKLDHYCNFFGPLKIKFGENEKETRISTKLIVYISLWFLLIISPLLFLAFRRSRRATTASFDSSFQESSSSIYDENIVDVYSHSEFSDALAKMPPSTSRASAARASGVPDTSDMKKEVSHCTDLKKEVTASKHQIESTSQNPEKHHVASRRSTLY